MFEDSAPDFCNKKWCYVDPDACTRNNPISSYFIKTKGFTEDMHYSYDTCGHENSWSAPAPVSNYIFLQESRYYSDLFCYILYVHDVC